MKFLHISDIHLGCTRYQLNESPRDFFDAWIDVLQKYAIGEKVDFVIMSGDFFHKRNVPPETMNYAFAGLSLLKDAGIPILTKEENHDQKHNDSEHSWLRSLANWNFILLEPKNIDVKCFTSVGRRRLQGGFAMSSTRGLQARTGMARRHTGRSMLPEAIKEIGAKARFNPLRTLM